MAQVCAQQLHWYFHNSSDCLVELGAKNVLKFHRYKYCTTKWVTHFVEQACSTDYHTVFRCVEEGQIPGFDPLLRKISCWSARKKAQILKMSTLRRKYVQMPGNSVLVSRFPCKIFPRMASQFFCLHDSPSNLAESRYPPWRHLSSRESHFRLWFVHFIQRIFEGSAWPWNVHLKKKRATT